MYNFVVKSYVKFCAFDDFQIFFFTIYQIDDWINSLKQRKLQSKIIQTYITIFRFVCIDRKYFDFNIFNEFLLQCEINEIKRMYEKREKREKKTIIRDILLQILKFFDIRIKNDAILHVAFCLIFANFLRIDEFIWSKIDFIVEFNKWRIIRFFVIFFDDHFILTFFVSKIDSFCKKISIFIVTTNDVVCAMISLRNLFERFSISTFVFLFQIDQSKIFNAKYVIIVLRNAIIDLKYDDHYSNHFFRRNVAIEIRNANVFDDLIQFLKKWKFETFLLYIEFNKKYIFQISRHHQNDWIVFFFRFFDDDVVFRRVLKLWKNN